MLFWPLPFLYDLSQSSVTTLLIRFVSTPAAVGTSGCYKSENPVVKKLPTFSVLNFVPFFTS